MTDLQKALREAVAFDESKTRLGWRKDLPFYDLAERTKVEESEHSYRVGATFENARLAPILAALELCVEALENLRNLKAQQDWPTDDDLKEVKFISDSALETLRMALERLEAK